MMVGVIEPCLARAVVLAREGQTVIYLVPSGEAAREAWQVVSALDDDVAPASVQFGILSVGPGSLQIVATGSGDLCDNVRGRTGLIVLHAGLRFQEWRSAALAINGHRFGSMLAQRADGRVPVPSWAVGKADPSITTETEKEGST